MSVDRIRSRRPDAPVEAVFDSLNAALLACDSATDVLERLFGCTVSIRRLPVTAVAPDADQIGRLDLHAGMDWAYRRVQLVGSGILLSEADLWYVPGRLEPAMASALLDTDMPFGRVVRPLGPRRTTIAARLIPPPSRFALEHRAVLSTQAGPIAEVLERYPARLSDQFG